MANYSINYTPEGMANVFNVSIERVKAQYLANAKGLEYCYKKALETGKKYRGKTAGEWEVKMNEYFEKAK